MKKLPIIFASLAMAITAGAGIANRSMKSASAADNVTASINSFSTISGAIDSAVFYEAQKGTGTSNPAIYNSQLRLYKPASGESSGGFVDIKCASGYVLKSVSLINSSDKSGSIASYVDGVVKDAKQSVSTSATYSLSSLNASKVSFYNVGTDRFSIAGFSVTYVLKQAASNPITAMSDIVLSKSSVTSKDKNITATVNLTPSNADEDVIWTSSNTAVATIEASDTVGVADITLKGVGTCTFAASNLEGTIKKTSSTFIVNAINEPGSTTKTVSEMIECTDEDYAGLYNVTGVIKDYYGSNTNMHENGRFVIADPSDDTKTITVYNCSADSTCLVWDSFAGKYNYAYKSDFLTNSVTKSAKIGDTIKLQATSTTYNSKKQLTGRVTKVEEAVVHVESINVSQASIECYVGATVDVLSYFSTVPAVTSYKLTIASASYPYGCGNVSYADGTFTALTRGTAEIEVGVTDPFYVGENKTLTINVLDKDNYVLASSINGGDTVVMVNSDGDKELTGINTSSSTNYGDASYFDTDVSASYRLQVVVGSKYGTWAFKTVEGKYLTWSSGNSLKLTDTVTDNSSWTVAFDEDNIATVANAKDSTRAIWWNSGSPRFATYTGKSANIKFYKVNRNGASDIEAMGYASDFLSFFDGICMPDGNTNLENLAIEWENAQVNYSLLSTAAKATIALTQAGSANDGEKAIALYEYIYAKYAETLGLENFLNRQIELSNSSGMMLLATDSSIMIILIASISLISVAGLVLFLKKRKHN